MSTDGVCPLVSEAIKRLEAEGWGVEIADDGLHLAQRKLTQTIVYQDSLTGLVDRGDTDDALWALRRAKSARKRSAA